VVLGHRVVSFPSRPAAPGPPGRKRRHPLNSDHAYTENRTDPFQAVRSWKRSSDPAFEAKKNRILELYAIADGLADAGPDDPTVVICLDEFGPLNLQPQPNGRSWAPRKKPRRIRATYTRPHGVRHLLCALDVADDLFSGEVTERKTRVEFLAFCDQVRARYPDGTKLAFVLDNFSVHKGDDVREWAATNNVSSPTRPTTPPG
jgi:hypothetical protein